MNRSIVFDIVWILVILNSLFFFAIKLGQWLSDNLLIIPKGIL